MGQFGHGEIIVMVSLGMGEVLIDTPLDRLVDLQVFKGFKKSV